MNYMDEINDFLGIAVVGVILSLAVEYIKGKWGSETFASRTIILVSSCVLGALYYWARSTPWWSTALGILASASTFYAWILAKRKSVNP